MRHLSVSEMLARAELMIGNAQAVPEIAAALARYGYDATRLEEGQRLLERLREAHSDVIDRRGMAAGASERFRKARAAMQQRYGFHLRLARSLFRRDSQAQSKLGLRGRRPRAFAPWVETVRRFYTHALEDEGILARMAAHGLGREVLEAALAEVEALEDARRAFEGARADALRAREERDAAMEALSDWLALLRIVARAALAEDPQLAEALGLRTPG